MLPEPYSEAIPSCSLRMTSFLPAGEPLAWLQATLSQAPQYAPAGFYVRMLPQAQVALCFPLVCAQEEFERKQS